MTLLVAVPILVGLSLAPGQGSQQPPQQPAKQTAAGQAAPSPQPAINVTVQAPQPDPKEAEAERNDRAANIEIQRTMSATNRALVVITFLQFLVAVLGFVIALKAAKISERAAEAAHQGAAENKKAAEATQLAAQISERALAAQSRLFRQENRPYVLCEAIYLTSPLLVGQKACVTADIKNGGKTPAIKMRVSQRVSIAPWPPTFGPFTFTPEHASVYVGVDGGRQIRLCTDATLTEHQLSGIRSGALFVCYSAMLRYEDVFGTAHETHACAYFRDPSLVSGRSPNDRFLDSHSEHNDLT